MSLSDYESLIKSYIYDEDKLVTYKWLSKELEVHVNVAKDILKQYWEKYQNKGDIVATYLLIGQLKDGSIRVEVVQDSNLKAAKDKFAKIDCEHFYSLQRCLPALELLVLADDGDLRYSSIKCNEQFIRNEDEVDNLKYIGIVNKNQNKTESSSKAGSTTSEKQSSKKTDTFSNKKTEKSDNHKKSDLKEKEKSKEEETKTVEVKPETKTVATGKKVSPPSKASGKGDKAGKKPLQSKQTGFNNLFGKVPAKPASNESEKTSAKDETEKSSTISSNKNVEATKDKEEQKKVQEKENSKINRDKDDKKQTTEGKSAKPDKKSKKTINTTSSKKRQRSQEKNTTSKRKRILMLDSSEEEKSDNEEEEKEEEEPMEIEEEPPKPTRKRSPSPPAEKRENGKRMVRKTIDKTYKDEEGYLVTKRVHVYEAVEDDDDITDKKVKEPPPKSKQVDSKAKKQTTLMSFFKKS